MQGGFLSLVRAIGGCWVCAPKPVGFDRGGKCPRQHASSRFCKDKAWAFPLYPGARLVPFIPAIPPCFFPHSKEYSSIVLPEEESLLGQIGGWHYRGNKKGGLRLKAFGRVEVGRHHKGHWLLPSCLSAHLQGPLVCPAWCSFIPLCVDCIHILLLFNLWYIIIKFSKNFSV